jgi:hypothetical protein
MIANFDAALDWHARGYNVVPCKAPDKKRPGIKWWGPRATEAGV